MSFVPLDPVKDGEVREPCRSPEHDPPTNIVIREPMKWVCPACGREVIIRPTRTYC